MSRGGDVERLLRQALAPVDPPEALSARFRATLQSISDMAAEELEAWERAAMRDPRNWVRPVIALIGGAAAGAGLLVIGRHQRRRVRELAGLIERRAADVAGRARDTFRSR